MTRKTGKKLTPAIDRGTPLTDLRGGRTAAEDFVRVGPNLPPKIRDRHAVHEALPVSSEEYFGQGNRACVGCAEALAVRLVCKALGDNVIIAMATGCMEIVSSQLPHTSWAVPWIHTLFENTAAVASGIEAGLKVMAGKGRRPEPHAKVVAIAGDGGTADIGMQALSGALERGHNFLFVCLDNEGYMNTGVQRSSSTSHGAATTTSPAGKQSMGQATWKKNMPAIAAAHDIPYVATACPSYPLDLIDKVARGAAVNGPAYVHILSVCPTGWRSVPEIGVRLGRLAVETGVFPLYEVENGQHRLTFDLPRLKPVREYLQLQGRFRHLSGTAIDEIQQRVTDEYGRLREKAKGKPKYQPGKPAVPPESG